MTANNDLDQQLNSFLREGPTELPYQSFDAVRDRTEETSQRVVFGPWRTPIMNRFFAIGVGSVAVVVVGIFLGARILWSPTPGGPGASQAAQPSTSAEQSIAEPSPSAGGGLPVGSSHVLLEEPVTITVSIPAPGWLGDVGGGFLVKNDNPDPPDGAGIIVFEGGLSVYGDPCHWETTTPDAPATTVDELVAALSAQASRDATEPMNVSVGGYFGKEITLHVPDDAVFSDCDKGYFGSWTVPGGQDPYRYHQAPGQIDEVYILDVNGTPVIIDTAYYAGTPPSDVDELRGLVESATLAVASGPTGVPVFPAPGDTSPVEPGPAVMWDNVHGGYNVTVTVQSSGWAWAENQHILLYGDSLNPPSGAGLLVFQRSDVPEDPCAWRTNPSVDTHGTAAGYVAALAGQASRDASDPVDVAVGGHPGSAITLHVPGDAVFSDCDQGVFATLTGRSFGDPLPWADRFAQGPGQIDEFWIVDPGQGVVMFDIVYGAETPQTVIDELRAMVESAVIGAYEL
jgi:hypothetical protein